MWKVQTNFGEHIVRIHPTLPEILAYYCKAHDMGIAIPDIKFKIVALSITAQSTRDILSAM